MPRERPQPPPFEPEQLDRSLGRYLFAGLVFMALLVAGFGLYRVREPSLRQEAARQQKIDYRHIGRKLYARGCTSCHGKNGVGANAPVLNSKEFLESTSDEQIFALVAGGVPGTDMSAWSIDFGGNFTDEQVREIVTYIRSWEPKAPSVPDWRQGKPDAEGEPADEPKPTEGGSGG